MHIRIKACTLEDLETLQDLSWRTFYDTFRPMNTEEDMKAYLENALGRDALHKELQNPSSAFFFLYADDELAGYIKLNEHPAQTDLHDPNALEIERIYVDKAFQGKGLGRNLINKAIEIANQKGLHYLWLGVWEKNEKAIAFYKSRGFYKIGQHDFLLGSDLQTDHIMRKDLE
ncbi:MAG: GNAT family N-acetyltransferase [Clostridia bacterium]|nr:GNAT family N-acetyltransferase [Clostridia bacterium]